MCLRNLQEQVRNGILLPKLFRPTVRKSCSSDREKLFKCEADGQEFALEQFIQQWKVRTVLVTECNRIERIIGK